MSCGGTTGCSMSSPKTFNNIDGTPIKYTGDCTNFSQVNVKSETSFYNMMVDLVRQMRWDSLTYGGTAFSTLSWIGHAGAYTCKNGCHGKGRAFDMDKVVWSGYTLNICGKAHLSSTLSVRRRFLAVSAECRYRFKYVLDGFWAGDSLHDNHIHFENHTAPILSKNSGSDVSFVQAVCNNFNSAGLAIDGVWGSSTQTAWNNINAKWHYSTSKCNPFSDDYHYKAWLYLVIAHGYDDVAAGAWWANAVCST